MMKSRLHFVKSLPAPEIFGEDSLLIYDRLLEKKINGFVPWAHRFRAAYPVCAGEELKDLRRFPHHMEAILQRTRDMSVRRLTIVVVGGGSVGDFGGFVASLLKRGVRLVHLPTTWLAAIDSSHGGKTALNVGRVKNQVGTFYPADDIYVVEKILRAQPHDRAREAAGELAKIALLDGRKWVKEMEATGGRPADLLWTFLPEAIASKYRITVRDPHEKKAVRQTLNLGHTLGHVLESSMGLPHGTAIAQGTYFSLEWGFKLGLLSARAYARAQNLMHQKLGLSPLLGDRRFRVSRPSSSVAKSLLLQDKKRNAAREVTFIFLKEFGAPVCRSVEIDHLLKEAKAQGWIR